MHRQRVPSLDTNSPVGWFARFIAIASTLGCGLAFSADKIPDMATNAVYDKIEAETPVAASSTMVDTQRARKKRAAKAKVRWQNGGQLLVARTHPTAPV